MRVVAARSGAEPVAMKITLRAWVVLLALVASGCAHKTVHVANFTDRERCALDGMVLVGKNYTSESGSSRASGGSVVNGEWVSSSASGESSSAGTGLLCRVPETPAQRSEMEEQGAFARGRAVYAKAQNDCEQEEPAEVCGLVGGWWDESARGGCLRKCAEDKVNGK
jgi:hypothetical protein